MVIVIVFFIDYYKLKKKTTKPNENKIGNYNTPCRDNFAHGIKEIKLAQIEFVDIIIFHILYLNVININIKTCFIRD